MNCELIMWPFSDTIYLTLQLHSPIMECCAHMWRGSYFVFFGALYCSCLGFNGLLALPTKEGGNKGIKSKKGAMKCCKENSYLGEKHIFTKLWLLLDLRAESGLRSTKVD